MWCIGHFASSSIRQRAPGRFDAALTCMLMTGILAGSFNQYEGMSKEKEDGDKATGVVQAGEYKITYACVSQRGHYPDQPFKANQDAVLVKPDLIGSGDQRDLAFADADRARAWIEQLMSRSRCEL